MAPLHIFDQDNQNQVHHNYVGHMKPLAPDLALCNADSAINWKTAFLRSRQLKWGTKQLCGNLMPFTLAWVSYAANSIINDTTAFLSLRQLAVQLRIMWCYWCWHQCHKKPMLSSMAPLHSLDQWQWKWGVIRLFWPSDTTGAGIGISWYQYHYQWHHCIPSVKMIKMRCNMTFLVMWPNKVAYFEVLHYCTYVGPKLLHIYVKLHPTATFITYAISPCANKKYVLKWHRYVTYSQLVMCTWGNHVSI